MTSNILVTGAAGYIGGSVVAYLRSQTGAQFKADNIIAAVRSDKQAQKLQESGIKVVQVDLNDQDALIRSVQQHNVDIIVHCASGLEPQLTTNLIAALGKQREVTGNQTYFVHTSGGSAFSEEGGWPAGETKDTDSVYDTENRLAESNPLRQTDVNVIDQAEAHGVLSYIVVPTLVYGRGYGEWNQLSVCLPRYIKASIKYEQVYKFAKNLSMPAVHLSDLMGLYARLLEKILSPEPPKAGKDGYFFVAAHSFNWYDALGSVATQLHSRGLVKDSQVEVWPNDEFAAEGLGLPVEFMHMIWNSTTNISTGKQDSIGWEPVWTSEKKFLDSMDDEVEAVQQLDKDTSSVFQALQS